MKETIESLLKSKGVSPTPVRILVYDELYKAEGPLSLTEIETSLGSVDKSTISRTLSTFKQKHIVHSFNDGSSSMKYELCHTENEETDDDMHVHFRCDRCGRTFCFNNIKVPKVELPKGFSALGVNYIITGTCNYCNKKEMS